MQRDSDQAPNQDPSIRIIRSDKRTKTISARLVDGVIEVRAPATISEETLQPHIDKLRTRLLRRQAGKALDDAGLETRAQQLNRQYFDGRLQWQSVRWVTNQNTRYGSCTPTRGTLRISHRIAKMPTFVLDYVLVHELAHLLEPNHGKEFWTLVNRYPKTERARGYLMAVGLEELDG